MHIQSLFTGYANGDGAFNSSYVVQAFKAGEYEDDIPDNSTFAESDWNGDGEFSSSDLVMAFQAGRYEQSVAGTHSDPAAAIDWLFSQAAARGKRPAA